MGPEGLGLSGALCALPLRAFFCSFSVSDDFFLISCLARLYSFAWSLSSWLADFFQSSMRSCSGLMRLSSRALWEKAVGEG